MEARLKCANDFDNRLSHLFDDMPASFVAVGLDNLDSPEVDWRKWAQYYRATAIPVLRLELWREFTVRSYADPRLKDARQASLAAARQVIAIQSNRVPAIYRKGWHVLSYLVIAGLTLADELAHSEDQIQADALRGELDHVLDTLRNSETQNAMTARGFKLLQAAANRGTLRQNPSEAMADSSGSAPAPGQYVDAFWSSMSDPNDPFQFPLEYGGGWDLGGFEGT